MSKKGNKTSSALEAARKDFVEGRQKRIQIAGAMESAAKELHRRISEEREAIPCNPNTNSVSRYFNGWRGVFLAADDIFTLAEALHVRRRDLIGLTLRRTPHHLVFRIEQLSGIDAIEDFLPALNAVVYCKEILIQSRFAWKDISDVAAHVEPKLLSEIQVTLQVLNNFLENTEADVVEILSGEAFRWNAAGRDPTEEEVAMAKQIVAKGLAEVPPRRLSLPLVRMSLIPVPPPEHRISRAIALARFNLAKAQKYCAQQLYEHAARMTLVASAIQAKADQEAAPELSPELLAEVRSTIRTLGEEAKANAIKLHLGRRSQSVSDVLAYLKKTGEWKGQRRNRSGNGSDKR